MALMSIEQHRLAELHRYDIIDTPPEEQYDLIVALAARFFDAPIAAVSLIDLERQWYKAKIGIDLIETARADSFCGHVIRAGEPLIVPDALADARFRTNPYVLGPPFVRFYAGAPLRTSAGACIGAICVAGPAARDHGLDVAATFLEALAARTIGIIEARVHRERDLYDWPPAG